MPRQAEVVHHLIRGAALSLGSASSSSMSARSKLDTPQSRNKPSRRSDSKASTVSASGMSPRQCRR